MNDPWRTFIDGVHAEIDEMRAKRGFAPYAWSKHEPVRSAYVDRIVEKINTEERTQMAFGDRPPITTPLGHKPSDCDNIPGYGLLRQGQCRTEDCDVRRHAMDKASGYCRPCKIKNGLLRPEKPAPAKVPEGKPWTPPTVAETLNEAVRRSDAKPVVPPELVDEVFSFLMPMQGARLLHAMVETWAEMPLTVKVKIVRAALSPTVVEKEGEQ